MCLEVDSQRRVAEPGREGVPVSTYRLEDMCLPDSVAEV